MVSRIEAEEQSWRKKKNEEYEYECIRCSATVKADDKFCPKCGDSLEEEIVYSSTKEAESEYEYHCTYCDSLVNADDKFCPECGNNLEDDEEFICGKCGGELSPEESHVLSKSSQQMYNDFDELQKAEGAEDWLPVCSKCFNTDKNVKLITCPDCGKKMSKRAAACPNCGSQLAGSTNTQKGEKGSSPFALACLCVSIVTMFTPVIFVNFIAITAVIFGIFSLVRKERLALLAIIGLILSVIMFVSANKQMDEVRSKLNEAQHELEQLQRQFR